MENKTNEHDVTVEDVKNIVANTVKESVPDIIKRSLKEQLEKERDVLFPSGNGKFGESDYDTIGGSVVDTKYFNPSNRRGADFLDGAHANIGGPFKRLSPQMETFAKCILARGNLSKAIAQGVDIREHNNAIREAQVRAGIIKQAGMNEGILADGGALVPIEFAATVIEFAFTQSPILSRVTRFPMTASTLRIPRLAQSAGSYFGGIRFFSPGEGEEKESSKPSFERLSFEAKKRVSLVYMTDELVADSLINIVNYITGLYTRAFMYDMENLVLTNTTAQAAMGVPCIGIVNDPLVIANGVARTTPGTVTYADLCNLDGRLDENFRDLVWMTRKNTLAVLRNERDLQNRPIVQVDYDGFINQKSVTPSIFGYPVYLSRNLPAIGQQGDIVLGDLSNYLLAIRQDLTIDMSEHVRFIYDEQTLRFVARYDGMPIVPIAFTELVNTQS